MAQGGVAEARASVRDPRTEARMVRRSSKQTLRLTRDAWGWLEATIIALRLTRACRTTIRYSKSEGGRGSTRACAWSGDSTTRLAFRHHAIFSDTFLHQGVAGKY